MLPFELHPLNKFDFAKKNKIIKKNKTKQQPPHTIFRIKLVYLLLCNINIFLRNTGLTPLFFFFFWWTNTTYLLWLSNNIINME